MRILLISEFFPTGRDLKFSGGVEARTFFIAKYLALRNQVFVVTSYLSDSKRTEKMFNFTVYRVGPKREYRATTGNIRERILFIRDAIRFCRNLDIDIVDGGNFISHFVARRVAKIKGVPYVAWYPDVWVGTWIKNSGVWGILGEILERLNLFLGADYYIPISKETAFKLKRFVKGRIKIIPCGVDLEFNKNPRKFKRPTIITVSRLAKYKNIKTLILAFAHLSVKIKDAELLIVGSGPDEKKLRELIKSLKLGARVKFFSNLSRKDLISLLSSSHIFSLPSIVEGFGIATIEAAACGLPYVNSLTPINKEVTRNGLGGFLVDPSKPLFFSEKFSELLEKKTLYKKKSEEAKRLGSYYNWQKIAKETEEVYKKLL